MESKSGQFRAAAADAEFSLKNEIFAQIAGKWAQPLKKG
jgi:hypothetical protein